MIKHLKPERFSRSKPLQLPRPARGFEREKCDPLPMKFSEEPTFDYTTELAATGRNGDGEKVGSHLSLNSTRNLFDKGGKWVIR